MKPHIRRICLWCLFAIFASPLTARAQRFHYAGMSPRAFVTRCYNWYVPLALNVRMHRSWDEALQLSLPPFSAALATLLRDDAAAQAECNELVGLDFDPFLATQDPAHVYAIGQITHAGRDYKAEIYGVDHGVRSKAPNLIAAFRQENGRRYFVNFYYLSPKPTS